MFSVVSFFSFLSSFIVFRFLFCFVIVFLCCCFVIVLLCYCLSLLLLVLFMFSRRPPLDEDKRFEVADFSEQLSLGLTKWRVP